MATRRGLSVSRVIGLLGLFVGAGAAQDDRIFDVPAYPVQLDPRQILIADLDGDGGLDQLVPNRGSNTVTVRRATGGGLYAAPIHVPVGTAPVALVAARFGGDLATDIAVLCEGSRDVHVLLSQSDGSFVAGPILVPPGTKIVSAIGAGDLDGDGHTDIVLTAHQPDTAPFDPSDIVVWFGLTSGGFSAPLLGSVPGRAAAVAVADLDNDGRDEVAVARSTLFSGVSIVKLAAPGVLVTTNLPLAGFPARYGILAADLTLDGQMDLLLVERDLDRLLLLQGPAFVPLPVIKVGKRPVDVAIGDLNGDAWPDLVVALEDSELVSLVAGTGPGTFAAPEGRYLAGSSSRVALADIDGDGHSDVLTLRGTPWPTLPSAVLDWRQGSDGSFPTMDPIALPPASFGTPGVGDVTGDGFLDLLVPYDDSWCLDGDSDCFFNYGLRVLRGSAQPGFVHQSTLEVWANGGQPHDLNGDGLLDVVVPKKSGLAVFISQGHGNFTGPFEMGVGVFGNVAVGDLDGDGLPELGAARVLSNPNPSPFIYRNGRMGEVWTSIPLVQAGQGRDLAFGDVDGDGDLDMALCTGVPTGSDTPVAVYFNDGAANFGTPVFFDVGPGSRSTVLADFDGDGLADLAVTSLNDGTVTIRRSLGGGQFEAASVFPAGPQSYRISATDLDGDGQIDLFVNNSALGFTTLLGDGQGAFEAPQSWFAGKFPGTGILADFDQDGLPDVIASTTSVDGLDSGPAIFLNRSGPWTDLGHPYAGGLPTAPRLLGQGPLTPASETRFVVHDAPASTALLLLFGVDAVFAPFKGGVLVPDPVLAVGGWSTDAAGVFILEDRWPVGLPAGFELYAQAWLAAPTPAASNALRARPGY